MTAGAKAIKPEVKALRAYSLSPRSASVKINQNENPWDVSNAIKVETLRRLEKRKWSRYPDFVSGSLHEHLAGFASWRNDGVIAGNGSNELIQATLMVTIGTGKRVLISEPTFALYRQVTTVLGGEVRTIPLTDGFQYNPLALLKSVSDEQPDVVILCSPNNPTGCLLADADLRKILQSAPGLVIIDEAYHEFARHSVVPLLREFENLVVLRTFSKAMALAGLRLGYLLASPALVTEIRKAVLPYNLNAFSQTAAEVAIEMYERELDPVVDRIVSERDRVFRALSVIPGLEPVASEANFMIVRSSIPPGSVFNQLLDRDILVRDVSSYPMLSEYFRVCVGTNEENDLLITALTEIMANGQQTQQGGLS